MCGIFGYVGKRSDGAELVRAGLARLEYRGYDSWGIAVGSGGETIVDKRVGRVPAATSLPPSGLALGHTRWATHGGVTQANAHPHLDCSGRVAVVHNGMVSNDVALRRSLERAGHRFASETDTELIAHLVEEALASTAGSDRVLRATMTAFKRLSGLNAIVVLDVETGVIAAAKNGSPLVIGFGEDGHFLSSDAQAIAPHARRVSFVAEGRAAEVSARAVRLFDLESGEGAATDVRLLSCLHDDHGTGEYPDYTTKEMHEQPAVLERVCEARRSVRTLAAAVLEARETLVVGCGSGYHAALAWEHAFARAGCRARAVVASEFAPQLPFVDATTLVIALSQSGETIDVLDATREARARGARTAAVTNVEGAALWRATELRVSLAAGPERAVVATKSFVAELAVGLLTAGEIDGTAAETAGSIRVAAKDVASLLSQERREAVRRVARAISGAPHVYVVGRGMSHAICLETALKIKEVSYAHAEGFAGGELKHGVIALVEPGTPCIVLAPNDATLPDTLSGAMQVKARGALVVGVGPEPHTAFDHHIPVADVGAATMIPSTVVAQLLGYDLARSRGNDPDRPRNLAKSVTVR